MQSVRLLWNVATANFSLYKALTTGAFWPLSRRDIGGRLVLKKINIHMTDTTVKLLEDDEFFGLTAMGDGATICKYPLSNILSASKSFI